MRASDLLKAIVLTSASLGLASCGGGNISGRLGADHTGDLSNPPAERSDPRAPLQAACGVALDAPTAAASPMIFSRTPYLQRTTASSADLVWISASGATPSTTITAPDGTLVAEVAATADTSASVGAGLTQWVAPVTGLASNTIYCYRVHAGQAASALTGFRTAPAAGAGQPIRFIAFGDSGSGDPDQHALADQMATVPFDLIVHTGDIAYDNGTREQFQAHFFGIYAGLVADFPIFPASGNHEYESADASPFREAFDLPTDGGPDGQERWYSFDWGDAHFVALDSERTGPVQAAWLEQDLSATRLPWTVVYWHKPPFSSGEHGNDALARQYFVPVLERHNVPLVLNGHDHDYERTIPQNGVTYVVTGGGGRGVRPMGSSSFTAFGDAVIHFVTVTIAGDTLELHAIDGLGKEFDSVVITR